PRIYPLLPGKGAELGGVTPRPDANGQRIRSDQPEHYGLLGHPGVDLQLTAAERVRGLLCPSSVAIVGASPRSGASAQVWENLQRFGFEGPVYLVNPNYD